MPPVPASKQFEVITGALALAEERESISLTEAALLVGVTRDQLIDLLKPVVYLEFRDAMGEVIAQLDAFDLDPDTDMLHVHTGNWLRDWDADAPPGDAAVRLFVTATVYQASGAASPSLDAALRRLRQAVAIDMVIPTERPAGLDVAETAYDRAVSLCFGYTKQGEDVTTQREVLPFDVYGEWSHWFVWGPEAGGGETKYWRVDRMSDVRLGASSFTPTGEVAPRGYFDLSHMAERVVVEVPHSLVAALPQPFSELSRTDLGDGRCRLEVTIAGTGHIDHFLVSLGPDGHVVAPAAYAERRRRRATELLAFLDAATTPDGSTS
jgi:hypothetical protein